MKISRFLPYSRQLIGKEEIAKINKVLKEDLITQGPEVLKFEKAFSKYVGAKYAVSCSSGTAALHLSCMALNITKKSKIITSSITFIASSNCAEFIGANVNFADIDDKTLCISTESLEEILKVKKIDAVIVVHLSGHSSDMEKIYSLKKKYNFKIIEDACHALGGKYKNTKVGSCKYSDISTFSFHPVKSITTGEGGMVTTNNKKIYEKIVLLRSHGINRSAKGFKNKKFAFEKNNKKNRWYYEMTNLGYNYRLTDLQASIGLVQLKKIDGFIKKRNSIAKFYYQNLLKSEIIQLPIKKNYTYHSYHLFIIKINFKKLGKSRNYFMNELLKNKIGSQVHYIPVFLHPYYKKKYNYKKDKFPNAMKYYEQALSIPIFVDLKKKEQKFIVEKINKLLSN
tara:strand:+ start:1761 stop:2951 length:1191 start_codon:yes stop_codon:yes gene_type:complete